MRNQQKPLVQKHMAKIAVSLMLTVALLCSALTAILPGVGSVFAAAEAETPLAEAVIQAAAPAVEAAPAAEVVPAMEEAFLEETAPIVEAAPVAEIVPVVEEASLEETAPAGEAAPVVEAAGQPADTKPDPATEPSAEPSDELVPQPVAPAEPLPVAEAPVDERSPLQRAIEDEGGAYVDVESGSVYTDDRLTQLMGALENGLAFAVGYVADEAGADAVCVIFRTEDDSLLTGFLPAYCATERSRQETVDWLIDQEETFLLNTNPDLPLSVIGYTPDAQEEADVPTEPAEPAADQPEESAPAMEDVEPWTAATLYNKVNLREEPSKDAALAAQLDQGTRMTVCGQLTDANGVLWYYVTYNTSPYYVIAEYVGAAEEPEQLPEAPVETAPPAEGEADLDAINGFAPVAFEGELPAGITANGDEYYTHAASDGVLTLLVYGSVNGGAPAFYPVDENDIADTSAPFAPEALILTVEPDEEPLAPFAKASYEGDPLVGLTPNEDGSYAYTAADGVQTLLVYGSANGGAPAFYAVDENGAPDLAAPFVLPEPAAPTAQPENPQPSFVPMTPDTLPDGYAPSASAQARPMARLLNWLIPSACAEADIDYGTVYEFKIKTGEVVYRVFGSLNGGAPSYYAFDKDAHAFLADDAGNPIVINPSDDIANMYSQDIAAALLTQIDKLPSLEAVRAMSVDGAEFANASALTKQVRQQLENTLWNMTMEEQAAFLASVGETAQNKLDTLTAYFAQLEANAQQGGDVSVFIPCAPEEAEIPPFYEIVYPSASKASPWGWLIASACADELVPADAEPPADTAPADETEGAPTQINDFELKYYFNVKLKTGIASRAFGSLNDTDPQYYAYDPATNALLSTDPIDPYTVDAANLPVLQSEGVSQSLTVKFERVKEFYNAGQTMHMRLTSGLASSNQADHVKVWIKIPTTPDSLELPQFPNDDSSYTYKGFTVTKVTEGGQSWLTYDLNAGDTVFDFYMMVTVPNGTTPNNTLIDFEVDESKIDLSTFSHVVPPTYECVNPTVKANFGWNDIQINTTPSQTSVTVNKKLAEDIFYSIFAINQNNNKKNGVIFTQDYTMNGVITLPDDLAWPDGTLTMSANGMAASIGGVEIAIFSLPVTNVQLSGKTLRYEYSASNGTLSGSSKADMQNLDMTVRLNTTKLLLPGGIVTLDGTEKITHDVHFEANACLDNLQDTSDKQGITTILKPASTLTLLKASTPGAATTVTNKDQVIKYTLTMGNEGNVKETVNVTDAIPANTVYYSDAACVPTSGIDFVRDGNNVVTSVVWNNQEIAPGATKTYEFYVKPAAVITDGTIITNQGELKSSEGASLALSNTVRNTYDSRDKIELFKKFNNPSALVSHGDIVNYTISVTNKNADRATGEHTVTDTLDVQLHMTPAQLLAFQTAYPAYTITYTDNGDQPDTFTITPVSLAINETKTFTFSVTVNGKKADGTELANNTPIPNKSEIIDLGLESKATVVYTWQTTDLSVFKTYAKPEKVSETATAVTYHIDFCIGLVNNGPKTDTLVAPLTFTDDLHGGWPVGIDRTAETGAITGVDSTGATVTGTWVRRAETASGKEQWGEDYYYEIIWPVTPVLNTNDTYKINYTVEAIALLDEHGNFSTKRLYNGLTVKNYTTGVIPVIDQEYKIEKLITKINNESTNDNKYSFVYPGDRIQYAVTASNNTDKAELITVTDTLPAIKGGSFQWALGDNVKVLSGEGTPTLADGKLVWTDISFAARADASTPTQKTWIIELIYPSDTTVLTAAFGNAGSTVINEAMLTCGSVAMVDHVTHVVTALTLTAVKTVDKAQVDSAADEAARTVVFTISDFGFNHVADGLSLLDVLTDVRQLFEIVDFDYGDIAVTDRTGAAKDYSVDFLFAEDGSDTVNVPVAAGATPLFPAERSKADVTCIRWNFGDVNSVTVNAPFKITCRAKTSVAGDVVNTVSYVYNGKEVETNASVRVVDSNVLSKVLLNADGVEIDAAANDGAANTTYTWRVRYNNNTQNSINIQYRSMTDQMRTDGLDTTQPLVINVKHTTKDGAPAANPATPAQFTFNAGSWGSPGVNTSFIMTFNSGVLESGDILELTYEVTTNDDFKKSYVTPSKYALYNKITARLTGDGSESIVSEWGPYTVKPEAVVSMKTALIGVLYQPTMTGTVQVLSDGFDQQYFYGDRDQNATRFDLVYCTVLCNSTDSTVNLSLIDDVMQGFTVADSQGDVVFTMPPYTSSSHLLSLKRLQGYYNSSYQLFAGVYSSAIPIGLLTNPTVGNGGYQQSTPMYFAANTTQGMIDKNQQQYTERLTLTPGQYIVLYTCVDPNKFSFYYNYWNTSTVALTHSKDIQYGASFDITKAVDPGVSVRVGDVDITIPGLETSVTPKVSEDGVINPETNKLETTVSLEAAPRKVGITKQYIGFYQKENIDGTDGTGNLLSYCRYRTDSLDPYTEMGKTLCGNKEMPDPEDYIVWEFTVHNSGVSSISDGVITEQLPDGYQLAWIGMKPEGNATWSQQMNIEGYLCMGDAASLRTQLLNEINGPTNALNVSMRLSADLSSFTVDASRGWEGFNIPSVSPAAVQRNEYASHRAHTAIPVNGGITFRVIARPKDGAHINYQTYTNTASYVSDDDYGSTTTAIVGAITAGEPISDGFNVIGCKAEAEVHIGGGLMTESYKMVRGSDPNPVTSKDAVNYADVYGVGANCRYSLVISNSSAENLRNFVIIDRMPQVGDVGVLNTGSARSSEFNVTIGGAPTVLENNTNTGGTSRNVTALFTIQYKTQDAAAAFTSSDWSGAGTGWSDTYTTASNAIRLVQKADYELRGGYELYVSFYGSIRTQANLTPGMIAYNNFAYRYLGDDPVTGLQDREVRAEPGKVGVRITGAYLALYKVDSEDLTPLAGATFGVYTNAECSGTPLCTFTTDRSGVAKTAPLPIGTTYYVKEITPPAGYSAIPTPYRVNLSYYLKDGEVINAANGQPWNETAVNLNASVRNVKPKAHIALVKRNNIAEPLQNAAFGVYPTAACTAGTSVATLTTDANGVAQTTVPLELKTWYLKEITPPTGYKPLTDVITVNLSAFANNDVVNAADNTLWNATDITQNKGVVNERITSTLWLTKKMANGLTADRPVTLTVTGRFDGKTTDSTKTATFTIAEQNGTTTKPITGIIPGNAYVIAETTDDYAPAYTAADADGQVDIDGTGLITIVKNTTVSATNNLPTASMWLLKHVEGRDRGETFTITVSGVFSDSVPAGATVTRPYTFDKTQRDTAVEVPNVMYGKTYLITETLGGDYYTTTYAATGAAMTDNAVKLGKDPAIVTVTNTINAPGKLQIRKTTNDTAATGSPFTVTVAGTFLQADGTEKYETKSVTVLANGDPTPTDGVEGLIISNRYTITETLNAADKLKYEIEYTNVDGNNAIVAGAADQTVIVNNKLRTKGEIKVAKQVAPNALSRTETYTFTLTGPNNQSYNGSITTAARGNVEWTNAAGQPVTLTDLDMGEYTLTEVQDPNSSYQLISYLLNGGTPLPASGPLTFTLTPGSTAVAEIVVNNEVKTGAITVAKTLTDHLGDEAATAAAQPLYVALYQANSQTPVAGPAALVWNAETTRYNQLRFEGLAYGDYIVREMVTDDGGATFVPAADKTGFPYTVGGSDGKTITLNTATPAPETPSATITNTQRYATVDISAEKLFAANSDKDILKDKTFTIRLHRTDNGKIVATGSILDLVLTGTGWTAAQTGVKLPAGEYVFEEVTDTAAADGWENTALSGTADGASIPITGGGTAPLQGTFTITPDQYNAPTNIQITLKATNRATSKPLQFSLTKSVDVISSADEATNTFTFTLSGKNGVISTGTIVKTATDPEAVVTWSNGFDPATYTWTIGETYTIKEAAHNAYQLKAVTGAGVVSVYEGDAPSQRLVGCSFTVTDALNVVTVNFENEQKVLNNVTLQKKVLGSDGNPISAANWLTGSRFEFSLYNMAKMPIGTMSLTDANAVTVTTTETLRQGGTYFIKEDSITPAGAYTLKRFVDGAGNVLPADTTDGTMYKFTAGAGLALVAENDSNPNSLSITKNRVGGNATDSFTFSVTIGGTAYSGSYVLKTPGTGGNPDQTQTLTATNGSISLLDDQTATIYGIANGAEFNIIEAPASGYVPGYRIGTATTDTPGDTATGTVSGATSVTYTNTNALLNVALTKYVSGNMADRDKAFTFTVAFRDENDAALPDTTRIAVVGSAPAGAEAPTITDVTISGGNGEATFTLKDKQSIEFKDLNKSWSMKIVEASYVGEGYATSFTDSKTGAHAGSDTDWFALSDAVWKDGKYETRSVAYTNSYNIMVPTGIPLDIWPFLLLLLVACSGAVWLAAAKRKMNVSKHDSRDGWK